MTVYHLIFIIFGAIIGSLARYGITLIPFNFFPNSELFLIAIINILGSGFMGILSGLPIAQGWALFLIIGLLGSFTTFSSFTAGFFKILEQSPYIAFIYFILSILGSFVFFWGLRTLTLKLYR